MIKGPPARRVNQPVKQLYWMCARGHALSCAGPCAVRKTGLPGGRFTEGLALGRAVAARTDGGIHMRLS